MKSLAVVLMVAVGFAAAGTLPFNPCRPRPGTKLGIVRLDHPNGNWLITTLELAETKAPGYENGTTLCSYLGHFQQKCLYAVVYEPPSGKVETVCDSGPVVTRYDWFYRAKVPLLLFQTQIQKSHQWVEQFAEDVSIEPTSKFSILGNIVKVYDVDCEKDFDLAKASAEPLAACGVVEADGHATDDW